MVKTKLEDRKGTTDGMLCFNTCSFMVFEGQLCGREVTPRAGVAEPTKGGHGREETQAGKKVCKST